jgi:pimeloyl-ACP methyl ester carboxylesterase
MRECSTGTQRWIGILVPLLALAGCGDDAASGEDADGDVPAEDGALPDEAGVEGDAGPDELPDEATADVEDGTDASAEDGAAPVDPSAPGSFTWTTVDDEVVRGGRTTPVSAMIPEPAGGAVAPLIVFLPGFQMQTGYYLPLLERLASHGFVVVRADPPSSLLSNSHPEQVLDVQAVLDWALDPGGPLAARVDAAHVAVTGHSAGGKIAAMVAFADGRVTGLLGLDPVNGSGPLGYSEDQPDIVPDQVAPLEIPVGFLGETVDAVAGLGGQACAPADQNFLTFYDAATSAPWAAAWEFPDTSHMDFVFDTSSCGLACRLCRDGSADLETIHSDILTLAVAFFRRQLLGETELEPWLTGALVPAGLIVEHRP